jgi:hypothetical protein
MEWFKEVLETALNTIMAITHLPMLLLNFHVASMPFSAVASSPTIAIE